VTSRKQTLLDHVGQVLGTGPYPLGPGSKEHKLVLTDAVDRLDLELDTTASKPRLCGAIVKLGQGKWDNSCWSTGSTITEIGLERFRDAVVVLVERRDGHAAQLIDLLDSPAGEGAAEIIHLSRVRRASPASLRRDAFAAPANSARRRALLEKANQDHHDVLLALTDLFEDAGARCRADPLSVDLVARWTGGPAILVEVKTVPSRPIHRARTALGQLYEYAYRLRSQVTDLHLAIAFDRPVRRPAWLMTYLTDDRNITVIWRERDTFQIRGLLAADLEERLASDRVHAGS